MGTAFSSPGCVLYCSSKYGFGITRPWLIDLVKLLPYLVLHQSARSFRAGRPGRDKKERKKKHSPGKITSRASAACIRKIPAKVHVQWPHGCTTQLSDMPSQCGCRTPCRRVSRRAWSKLTGQDRRLQLTGGRLLLDNLTHPQPRGRKENQSHPISKHQLF